MKERSENLNMTQDQNKKVYLHMTTYLIRLALLCLENPNSEEKMVFLASQRLESDAMRKITGLSKVLLFSKRNFLG